MHKQPPWFWLVLWLLPLAVQAQDVFTLTTDQLQNGQSVELDKLGWKYLPDSLANDDPRFADPQFDDRAWETLISTVITLDSIPKSGWRGIGWFRLRLQVDPALGNQPLALRMSHFGAAEIYVDGTLVQRFGTVGATPETEVEYNPNRQPFYITFDGRGEHVIAVRHSCMAMRDLSGAGGRWGSWSAAYFRGGGAGFSILAAELRQALLADSATRKEEAYNLLRVGLFLAIGLLYLLLYGFYRQQRANLFFGLYACAAAANIAIVVFWTLGHPSIPAIVFLGVVNTFTFTLRPGLLLVFVYATFSLQIPKWFWLWLIAVVSFAVGLLIFPGPNTVTTFIVSLPIFLFPVVEMARVVIHSIRKRIAGAWLIGISVLLFMSYAELTNYGLITATATIRNTTTLILIITIAIYLARQFARTNLDLKEQLVQVKQLSAAALEHEKVKVENDRRAAELEEARQLQLSMLPKKLPSLPHLDIAAYMKTASEVGGDYYDFHVSEDGTLTIAVGDATGHGLKAGTLVSSVKSLFISLAHHPEIPHIFHRISGVLKEMKLRGLFMAMTMVKVKGNQMSVSIAGMPSVLIYRALSGEVEEVVMRALPLGGMAKYQYQQQEVTLNTNDVVVLMSDGLPERFNPQGEMLEEQAAKQYLVQHAQASAQELIAGLAKLGDDWGGVRPQDDDVTFVVVKVKE